jgi:hypothetical protein
MRRLQLAAGILVSAFCLWLSMRDVDPVAVWHVLRHANYLGFVGVVCATLAGTARFPMRWPTRTSPNATTW